MTLGQPQTNTHTLTSVSIRSKASASFIFAVRSNDRGESLRSSIVSSDRLSRPRVGLPVAPVAKGATACGLEREVPLAELRVARCSIKSSCNAWMARVVHKFVRRRDCVSAIERGP